MEPFGTPCEGAGIQYTHKNYRGISSAWCLSNHVNLHDSYLNIRKKRLAWILGTLRFWEPIYIIALQQFLECI